MTNGDQQKSETAYQLTQSIIDILRFFYGLFLNSSRMCSIHVVALLDQVEPAYSVTSATSIAFGIQNLLEIHAPRAFCVRRRENVYQPKRRKRLSKVHKVIQS